MQHHTNIPVTGKALYNYLPQRPPFIMVDELLDFTPVSAQSKLTVSGHNILVEKGALTDSGLIENMAQTTALIPGANAQQKKEKAPVGFIAVVKSTEIYRYPVSGETIQTSSKILQRVLQMEIAQVKITDSKGQTIALGELRIFLQE